MNFKLPLVVVSCCLLLISCSTSRKTTVEKNETTKTNPAVTRPTSTRKKTFTQPLDIDREEFVGFAKTLLGTRYKYASAIPANGLDCSGFIYYVFGHFNVKAPRSSVDFTNEGETIDVKDAEPGDIILFTGSDNSSGIVGHMGIITESGPLLKFIHSASGRSVGVIINTLTGYYKTHFVKVIRILK
ncbi:C40 family peptidase [Ferruginibacter sp. HRS2-29]|uniref:C40 family peptidase n=1 Tax=Ferruginibacter sp. HRS2-29 TaxID=2487334 RepID=UPI0020CBE1AE|nr:NlpC/P60 family protein [Ferruginibacter sp. HRS2-29]MCP9751676.1 peptidoglycan endopeptidase [Ferruginibacter sp. HRS2-29]